MTIAPPAASLLARCLHAHGVRHIFGMPGSHATSIYDALAAHGGITTTLVRNEQAAAFMADGFSRVTGAPGVVVTTAGPGATNALTGVAEAYSDSVPVLLLAGQVSHDRIGEECGRYHELDLESVFRPCTRLSSTLADTAAIPSVIDAAFDAMLSGRPGPAAVFLPQDLMASPCDVAAAATGASLRRVPAAEAALAQALVLLERAERPVILAGGGAVVSGAADAVLRLANALDCPIVSTLNGKGIVDERHARAFGHGRTRRARLALGRADLLIAIGCRFTEVFTASGTMPMPPALLQIDLEPGQIGRNYPATCGLVGDARTVVESLAKALPARTGSWRETWQRLRTAPQLKPEWMIDTLRDTVPEDAVVFADACEMGLRMQTDFAAYGPRTFFYPSTFASLGWGFPAAVGGAVAAGARWTVCVAGDGGFTMAPQELATAARYHLNLIVVVHNDATYGAIKQIQRIAHDARYVDTDLNNPDFLQLAASFGVPAVRATSAGELASCVRTAIERGGPCLIEVPDTWRSLRIRP